MFSVEVEAVRQIKKLDEGFRLRVEFEDDLWVLSQLCRPSSILGMLSYRRDSTTGTQIDGRAKSAERKPMWIVLDVEKTEFQPFTDRCKYRDCRHLVEQGCAVLSALETGNLSQDRYDSFVNIVNDTANKSH